MRKLAMGAWERNITPQSIMRFTGPFGPSLVAAYTSRRFAHLEEDEQKASQLLAFVCWICCRRPSEQTLTLYRLIFVKIGLEQLHLSYLVQEWKWRVCSGDHSRSWCLCTLATHGSPQGSHHAHRLFV